MSACKITRKFRAPRSSYHAPRGFSRAAWYELRARFTARARRARAALKLPRVTPLGFTQEFGYRFLKKYFLNKYSSPLVLNHNYSIRNTF